MRRRLVLVLVGCGRLAFDPRDDARSFPPWGMPEPVMELAAAEETDDPSLTEDQLELYFTSMRPGGVGQDDIWVATRASTDLPFSSITNVTVLNSTVRDTTAEISSDGLTIYFSSFRAGSVGQSDLWVSTRPTRAAAWSPPVVVTELASTATEESPTLDATGTTMYFDSDRLSSTSFYDTIFIATRPDTGSPWSTPELVSELDLAGEEENPFLERGGLVMWLSVDPGTGFDIAIAERASVTAPFGPYRPVTEINTSRKDSDAWLSSDGRTLYFASDRAGGAQQIYRASR